MISYKPCFDATGNRYSDKKAPADHSLEVSPDFQKLFSNGLKRKIKIQSFVKFYILPKFAYTYFMIFVLQ